MNSIWDFLIYTIAVSMTAAAILMLKWIFKDKLSPGWQYGIWSVLAAQILVPGVFNVKLIPQVQLWIEIFKASVEKNLTSSYTDVYELAQCSWPIFFISEAPVSITDILFLIYGAGVAVWLLMYIISYGRLRIFLMKRGRPSEDVSLGNKGCRVVEVDNLPSPFVCGIIHPVMAVPAGKELDEKIILHEMVHVIYRDALQNVFWAVLRAIHWCNPFLQYVFNRIGNDMESLCDHRVLERLEGEERREYGSILLQMATDKYARMAGTSSISNGGKNISKRIESLVRFKKYPKGMGLVSVCICLVLGSYLITGPAATAEEVYLYQMGDGERAMAEIRINRCETPAAALACYSKALITGNSLFYGMVSPYSVHREIAEDLYECSWAGYDVGMYTLHNSKVYNLKEIDRDKYTAVLSFTAEKWTEGDEWEADALVMNLPVTVSRIDGWCVEPDGNWQYEDADDEGQWFEWEMGMAVPAAASYRGEGKTGIFTAEIRTEYEWENRGDHVADLDQDFSYVMKLTDVKMDARNIDEEYAPEEIINMMFVPVDSESEKVNFTKMEDTYLEYGNSAGESTDGSGWASQTIDSEWDGYIRSGGGTGTTYGYYSELTDEFLKMPKGYKVCIVSDREKSEIIYAGEV